MESVLLNKVNETIKTDENNRAMYHVCYENKSLHTRITKQESQMQHLQTENKALHKRLKQYEHCLDDIMRKVVDALVEEENLRDEIMILKNRVNDLEEQNALLLASPVKTRDEGYCTLSSGQPQPSIYHLEDLPEEPEHWFAANETAPGEMEDWTMSQEELETALEEETELIFGSTSFDNFPKTTDYNDTMQSFQEDVIANR